MFISKATAAVFSLIIKEKRTTLRYIYPMIPEQFENEFLDVGKKYKHATENREQASKFFENSHRLYDQSQKEIEAGDQKRAKELILESEAALTSAERANILAAKETFASNNKNKLSTIIDFQGLYVCECIDILKNILLDSIGVRNELKIIVSKKTSKSKAGLEKLQPKIEKLCSEANLVSFTDPKNEGTFTIDLRGTLKSQFPDSWSRDRSDLKHDVTLPLIIPEGFWAKARASYNRQGMRNPHGGVLDMSFAI